MKFKQFQSALDPATGADAAVAQDLSDHPVAMAAYIKQGLIDVFALFFAALFLSVTALAIAGAVFILMFVSVE